MILTIAELCDKAGKYLQSINIGNKNSNYVPDNTLKNGNTIKTYKFEIPTPSVTNYYPHDPKDPFNLSNPKNTKINRPEDEITPTITSAKIRTIRMYIKTNEDIPIEYLRSTSDFNILQDWSEYKKQFIYTKIDSDAYVGVSSLFVFLYLFRYFVDSRFCQFSDIYTQSNVWLYNTGSVDYDPAEMLLASNSIIDKTLMDTYINTLVTEIVNRDTHKVLGAAASTNSCSSSSSSSSCSSSSSSSSCSSSSSSSSSLFIAYFNLG